MTWGHLLAAADSSPAGLHAAKVARQLAETAQLRLTIMTVLPPGEAGLPPELDDLEPVVVNGVPGIEIVRMADQLAADLLVLGRAIYRHGNEPSLGPTADLVVRRSRTPCLMVPELQDRFGYHLVAIDGTERGYSILSAARELSRVTGGELHVVTVEPADPAEAHAEAAPHHSRTLRVASRLDSLAKANGVAVNYDFRVLRGEPVRLLTGELKDSGHDLLVVGSRRGGPAGLSVSTGVGRALLFSAQCAVLTVPL